MSVVSIPLILATLIGAEAPPPPSTGFQWTGGRGLSQTRSADALGAGVFLLGLRGSTYPTDRPVDGSTPPAGAMVSSFLASAGIGANSFMDFTAWTVYYSVSDWPKNPNSAGFGASGVTAKIAIPFEPDFPFRLAFQGGVIAGASADQINTGYDDNRKTSYADAYSYFDNRIGYDFEARILQTFRFVSPSVTIEVHGNQGVVTTLEDNRSPLAVLDGGISVTPTPILTLGVEGHMRTFLTNPQPFTDPLWATGTMVFHVPQGPDLAIGADFSASTGRKDSPKIHSLEPWRAFLHVAMPFDLGAQARENARLQSEKAKQERDALEKRADENERRAKELEARTAELDARAKELAEKARLDSINAAQTGLSRDAYRRRADSLDAKRAAAEKALADERAKSGNLEAELLNTGLVALDAVYFQTGKSLLTANSKPYLKLVGSILAKYPRLKLEIGGHTDNKGGVAANKKLSQARAGSVRAYLVSQFPILANSLVAVGYGSSQPKTDNATEEAREQNRRVEIKVLNPEILKELRGN